MLLNGVEIPLYSKFEDISSIIGKHVYMLNPNDLAIVKLKVFEFHYTIERCYYIAEPVDSRDKYFYDTQELFPKDVYKLWFYSLHDAKQKQNSIRYKRQLKFDFE